MGDGQDHPSQAAAEELVVETDGSDVFIEEMRTLLSAKVRLRDDQSPMLSEGSPCKHAAF